MTLSYIADNPGSRKKRMRELLIRLGLEKRDDARFVILRRNRGQLLRRPKAGGVEISADGCVECGTCRIVTAGTGEIEWNYPRGGFGVLYKFG
jgi:hypothetical protein